MTSPASDARREYRVSPCAFGPTTPAALPPVAGGFSLQQRIDAAQGKADSLKGKRGYSVALDRLRNAKLAALAGGQA